jgi:hypothetical protein
MNLHNPNDISSYTIAQKGKYENFVWKIKVDLAKYCILTFYMDGRILRH